MNKKRFLSVLMIFVMVIAMAAAGCGKKEEAAEEKKDDPKVEESTADDQKAEEDVEDPEADATEPAEDQNQVEDDNNSSTKSTDLSGAAAEMGVSEDKVQELHDTVKKIIEEKYFPKYNVSSEDFEWPRNDGNADDADPWIYLQERIANKIYNNGKEENPTDYNMNEQLTDLMDCVYEGVSDWIDTNDYYGLFPLIMWDNVFAPYEIW